MTATLQPTDKPALALQVFSAEALIVTYGANLGDPLSFAQELFLDDVFGLTETATPRLLLVQVGDGEDFAIAANSETGHPGADLHLDCCITLMTPDGRTCEVLVIVETDDAGDVAEVYALPLSVMRAKTDYTLVGISRETARARFAELACVSFARGTRITLISGEQVPIEELEVGDKVLTRDDGGQAVRWIGQNTVRAVGDFAPILIRAGSLHNAHDLLLSPDHRLFIYQRNDEVGAGRSEILVKARHLVDGFNVLRQPGGFVDYFQLLFDDHQIIYAEGIAAETMLVTTRTRAVLPEEMRDKLLGSPSARAAPALEITETHLEHSDAAALLRRASLG